MSRRKDKKSPHPAAAETARQEGAQGRVGKTPDDAVRNGEIDTSDAEAAKLADRVHANA